MKLRKRNPSRETLAVLAAFLEDHDSELYGMQVCGLAGLPSGSLYPILARLEQSAILSSRWETDEEAAGHRGRRRRYYRLTPTGVKTAATELDAAQRQFRAWQLAPDYLGAM